MLSLKYYTQTIWNLMCQCRINISKKPYPHPLFFSSHPFTFATRLINKSSPQGTQRKDALGTQRFA